MTDSTGDTENSYLYRGEQFDSFTGLYYLRARYMNPSTGTFITMDEYAGSVFEPVSLHKYLYANANPVTYSDPTGYFSLSNLMASVSVQNILSSAVYGACYGAIFGGMINSLLTTLRGGTAEEAQQAFLDGLACGFVGGGAFGTLGAFASVFWQAKLILAAAEFTGGYFGFRSAIQDFISASKSEGGEAVGYYTAGVIESFLGFVGMFSSAKNFNAAADMYHNTPSVMPKNQVNPQNTNENNAVGSKFDPNGPRYQVGVDPKSLIPQKRLDTLDPQRQANAIKYGGDHAIEVDHNGVIQDGHHRVSDAIKNNRAVDIFIVY